MNTAKLITLGLLRGSGAVAITYLFRDEFTTAASAPLGSPLTAEPGPGEWTVTDTGNKLTKAGGALVVAGNINSEDPKIVFTTAFSRSNGRMIQFLFSPGGTLRLFARVNANMHVRTSNGLVEVVFLAMYSSSFPTSGQYRLSFITYTAGFSVFGNEALLWIDYSESGSLNTIGIAGYTAIGAGYSVSPISGRDLPSLTTIGELASLDVSNPVDATEYTGEADGILEMTVTAPGSLDGDPTTRCGFYYRADADLTPAWHCYVAGDGTFNLDSIASDGTRTNQITVAAVIVGSGTRTLRVSTYGTKHNAYSLSGTSWTKRGAEITLSLNDTAVRLIPSVPAGWSIANLRSYPRTSSLYDVIDPN